MSAKFFTVLGIMSFLFITSCKKDSDTTTTTYPIQGLWVGTYEQPSVAAQYFSFIIKSDGTLLVEDKGNSNTIQYILKGTWTLSGNIFTANYINIYNSAPPSFIGTTQSATATFDNSGKLTAGVWTTTSAAGSGTFTLNRVN